MSLSLEPGALVSFYYPRHNFHGVLVDRLELRRLRVDRVVDFRDEAPDASYPMEPNLRRGKLLVVGYDLDKHAVRRFYVESMVELRELDRSRSLPPLRTMILKDGQRVEPAERPDPRNAFVASFNEQAGRYGMEAVA